MIQAIQVNLITGSMNWLNWFRFENEHTQIREYWNRATNEKKTRQNQTIHCNRFINLCELCCVWSCSVVPRHYSKSKMSFNQTLKSKYNIRSIIASRRSRNDTCSLKSRLRCRLFNETFESISSATDNDATVVYDFNDFMCGVFHLTQTATIFRNGNSMIRFGLTVNHRR